MANLNHEVLASFEGLSAKVAQVTPKSFPALAYRLLVG